MPELPEVDAVARRLDERVRGETIVAARFLRPQTTRPVTGASVARRLKDRRIERVWRRAKNVLVSLSGGMTLRVHLRMTGNVHVLGAEERSPASTRAEFWLGDGRRIAFEDQRLLGRIELLDARDLRSLDDELGVEPLTDAFTPRLLSELLSKSRRPLKLFLLDQSRICGLGNIWAAEALFLARLDPRRQANSVTARSARALHQAIRDVLGAAVESAYRTYTAPGQTLESEGYGVHVYGREGERCTRCRHSVERIGQGGRSTYFCPRCQR